MKQLGFRKTILISVSILLFTALSMANYFTYSRGEDALKSEIDRLLTLYVHDAASGVESYMEDKLVGIRGIAEYYQDKKLEDNYIELTKMFSGAMATKSFAIGLDTGEAYWSQPGGIDEIFTNHKYKGDITKTDWWLQGTSSNSAQITDPYTIIDDPNVYWVSVTHKLRNLLFSADFKLGFFDDMVDTAKEIEGSYAVIISQDTLTLASASDILKVGTYANSVDLISPIMNEVVKNNEYKSEYQLKDKEKIVYSKRMKIGDKNWYYILCVDKEILLSELHEVKWDSIYNAVGLILISLLILFFVIKILFNPILELKDTIHDLSQGDGDLTQRLEVKTDDELGEIALGVNLFIKNLQSTLLQIESSTTDLKINVELLTKQTDENTEILSQHTIETEQIVTAIDEMTATAKTVAEHAVTTARFTSEATTIGNESLNVVVEAQKQVGFLVDTVEETSSNIHKMSEETQGINSILDVIGDIADQTNLLALNAAIEAARAGEQGRGFAVVADEVRALANRTQVSTKEIETALTNLISDSTNVTNSMISTKDTCQKTFEGSTIAENKINSLSEQINHINDLSVQIATASEEQDNVTQEISKNMNSISNMVSNLNENDYKTSKQAKDIYKLNNKIVKLINNFRLK